MAARKPKSKSPQEQINKSVLRKSLQGAAKGAALGVSVGGILGKAVSKGIEMSKKGEPITLRKMIQPASKAVEKLIKQREALREKGRLTDQDIKRTSGKRKK